MADPLFWLALSFLLVVISLTAVLMVAIPAMRELGRAARSAEKMFDTLSRELPPTLEAIRLTGLEITELTDDVSEGVQSAGQVVQQVNQGISTAQSGAKRLNTGTKRLMTGAKAAWRAWTNNSPPPRSQSALTSRDRASLPRFEASDSPVSDRHQSQSASSLDDSLTQIKGATDGDAPVPDRRSDGAEIDQSSQRSPQEASRQTNYD